MHRLQRVVASEGKVVCWKTLGLCHLLEEWLQVPPALERSTNFLEESQRSHLLFARGAHKVDVVADVVLIAGRSECSNPPQPPPSSVWRYGGTP